MPAIPGREVSQWKPGHEHEAMLALHAHDAALVDVNRAAAGTFGLEQPALRGVHPGRVAPAKKPDRFGSEPPRPDRRQQNRQDCSRKACSGPDLASSPVPAMSGGLDSGQ